MSATVTVFLAVLLFTIEIRGSDDVIIRDTRAGYRKGAETVTDDAILQRVTSLEDNFRSFGQRLTSVNQGLTSLDHQTNSLDHRLTSFDHRLSSLDFRITSVDHRLTSLDHRESEPMGELNFVPSDENAGIRELLGEVKTACSDIHTATQYLSQFTVSRPPHALLQTPFKFQSATRKRTADGHTVRVTYEAAYKPNVYFRSHLTAPRVSVPVTDHQSGVVEVKVKVTDTHPMVLFELPDILYSLWLQLQPGGPNHQQQQLPNAELLVHPGSDVTYTQGRDARINVTVIFDGDGNEILTESLEWSTTVVSLDGEVEGVRRHASHTKQLPVEHNGTDRTYQLLITDSASDGGFVDINVNFYVSCSGVCLLRELAVFTSVEFYPDNQLGPFPRHFLAFVEDPDKSENKQYCEISRTARRNPCVVSCEAVGDNLKAVQISRVLPNLSKSALNYVPTSLDGVRQVAQFVIDDVTLFDAGEYVCTARSRTREISKMIELEVIRAAQIVREMSSLTTLYDGSLQARCAAEGTPAPNITFEHGWSPLIEYDVTVTYPNSSLTVAEMKIPSSSASDHMFGVMCTATNGAVDSYDTYSIPPSPSYRSEFLKSYLDQD